jgi:hypothetical protein
MNRAVRACGTTNSAHSYAPQNRDLLSVHTTDSRKAEDEEQMDTFVGFFASLGLLQQKQQNRGESQSQVDSICVPDGERSG